MDSEDLLVVMPILGALLVISCGFLVVYSSYKGEVFCHGQGFMAEKYSYTPYEGKDYGKITCWSVYVEGIREKSFDVKKHYLYYEEVKS